MALKNYVYAVLFISGFLNDLSLPLISAHFIFEKSIFMQSGIRCVQKKKRNEAGCCF